MSYVDFAGSASAEGNVVVRRTRRTARGSDGEGAAARTADAETHEWVGREVDKLLRDECAGLPNAERKLRDGLARVRPRLTACLRHAQVPPDNNGSDRVIRNLKVKLKVSGQWRSTVGTNAYLALRSVIETAIKQELRPLDLLGDPVQLYHG